MKRALVSVFDKSNLESLANNLKEMNFEVFSTGGTAKKLKEYGLEVNEVSSLTGFPEVLDGRVKTLHPHIYMPLLATDKEEHQKTLNEYNLKPFDLVVCNLYDFQSGLTKNLTPNEMIELIDIGGPCMLRAAAKNFAKVTVMVDPTDYNLLPEAVNSPELRQKLSAKTFSQLAHYNSLIAAYLGENSTKTLRYGENPHQKASWSFKLGENGLQQFSCLQGKELSYNNLLDVDAAATGILNFKEPAVISVKHNNPCGIGVDENIEVALKKSLKADPMSVFGGIIALNRPVNTLMASELSNMFLEVVIAPSFEKEALAVLSKKKNLRLLESKEYFNAPPALSKKLRSVKGGFLEQSEDSISSFNDNWEILNSPMPIDDSIKRGLNLAWTAAALLKSNAISITSNNATLGLGMGQVSRVDAVEQAIGRWKKFHPEYNGLVFLGSDAFFPFEDSIIRAHNAGVHWVIQPGGSKNDSLVIDKCKELGIGLVLTGQRHFLH